MRNENIIYDLSKYAILNPIYIKTIFKLDNRVIMDLNNYVALNARLTSIHRLKSSIIFRFIICYCYYRL